MKKFALSVFALMSLSFAASAEPYPTQSFDCGDGLGTFAKVVLQDSGFGQIIVWSPMELLDTKGRKVNIGYQGGYDQDLTTFSSKKRSNGTYLEFTFQTKGRLKSWDGLAASVTAMDGDRWVANANVICKAKTPADPSLE